MTMQEETGRDTRRTLERRGILAAAGAVVAGIMAKQLAEPVAASSALLVPTAAGETGGLAYGVVGQTQLFATSGFTSVGAAVFSADATGAGAVRANGVQGNGKGDFSGLAGFGGLSSGNGVFGQGGTPSGTGVMGIAAGGPIPSSPQDAGVYGASGIGVGVAGISLSNDGVFGSGKFTGVEGVIPTTLGTDNQSAGVRGQNFLSRSDAHGVVGTTINGIGVYGTTTGLYGVRGDAGSAPGSAGVLGYSNQAGGVAFGTVVAAPATTAGFFGGNVTVNGNFSVTGTKNAAVKDAAGNLRLMYCIEAPESWFEDVGTGTLVGGTATVTLDPEFAALVKTDDYRVFPVPEGDCKGLYVASRSASGFTVRELQGGTSTIAFGWRVMAKRGDVKGERLAKFTLPTLTMPEPIALTETPPPVQLPSTVAPVPTARTATTGSQTNAPNAVTTPTTVPSTGPAPAPPRRP